jgi:hypothetical protein
MGLNFCPSCFRWNFGYVWGRYDGVYFGFQNIFSVECCVDITEQFWGCVSDDACCPASSLHEETSGICC